MAELALGGALLLAFVNGANDNFKGVATLYGSGLLSYRKALTIGTAATALGGIVSLGAAALLMQSFSAKGLVPDAVLSESFLASVALAAALSVLLATRLGFPVSTTHALVGALLGSGWVAAGSDLDHAALGHSFALPLLAGPVLAIGLAFLGLQVMRQLQHRLGVLAQGAVNTGHLLSAAMVSFARGLNDTPKILGLVVGTSVLSPVLGTLAITACMALGGAIGARQVAETLARKITPMTAGQGTVGNLATAFLVIGASRVGLPVSTTHVSTGGIFGIGADSGGLRWRAAAEIVAAWVVTLPVAAILAAGLQWGLR